MRQWHFIMLLAWPPSGRRDGPVRHRDRMFLISALSAMAYMLPSPSALPQASQGTEDASGQQAFNNACRTCHMVKEGDNRLGPNLYKVVGRKAGSLPDYGFSSAMKEAGFVWDEEKLDRFIANPDEVVPGNSMKPYGGLSSSDDQKKDHRLPCSIAITRLQAFSARTGARPPRHFTVRADAKARSIACVTITAERSSR